MADGLRALSGPLGNLLPYEDQQSWCDATTPMLSVYLCFLSVMLLPVDMLSQYLVPFVAQRVRKHERSNLATHFEFSLLMWVISCVLSVGASECRESFRSSEG